MQDIDFVEGQVTRGTTIFFIYRLFYIKQYSSTYIFLYRSNSRYICIYNYTHSALTFRVVWYVASSGFFEKPEIENIKLRKYIYMIEDIQIYVED